MRFARTLELELRLARFAALDERDTLELVRDRFPVFDEARIRRIDNPLQIRRGTHQIVESIRDPSLEYELADVRQQALDFSIPGNPLNRVRERDRRHVFHAGERTARDPFDRHCKRRLFLHKTAYGRIVGRLFPVGERRQRHRAGRLVRHSKMPAVDRSCRAIFPEGMADTPLPVLAPCLARFDEVDVRQRIVILEIADKRLPCVGIGTRRPIDDALDRRHETVLRPANENLGKIAEEFL